MNETELRPRHYAAKIVELKTREERAEAMKKVPEHYRKIVRTHIEIAFSLKKWSKKSK